MICHYIFAIEWCLCVVTLGMACASCFGRSSPHISIDYTRANFSIYNDEVDPGRIYNSTANAYHNSTISQYVSYTDVDSDIYVDDDAYYGLKRIVGRIVSLNRVESWYQRRKSGKYYWSVKNSQRDDSKENWNQEYTESDFSPLMGHVPLGLKTREWNGFQVPASILYCIVIGLTGVSVMGLQLINLVLAWMIYGFTFLAVIVAAALHHTTMSTYVNSINEYGTSLGVEARMSAFWAPAIAIVTSFLTICNCIVRWILTRRESKRRFLAREEPATTGYPTTHVTTAPTAIADIDQEVEASSHAEKPVSPPQPLPAPAIAKTKQEEPPPTYEP